MATAAAIDSVQERLVNPWIIAVAVMLGTFMEVLDTTVVNVSLPHIAGNLSASTEEATWVLTSYLVSNAIVLPMTGWLSNHFGRKRVLMVSILGFTVSSVACGMAPSLPLLILFRVIQGATGGGLQPLSQAIMLEAFPPDKRGKAMAFWGLGIVVAPMLGPVMGGWITENYSWRWVFYINLPVGLLAMLMSQAFIHDPKYISRKSQYVDYWGIGLLAVGMGALQIMLDKGQQEDWLSSNFIVWLMVAAIGGLVFFIINELFENQPIVNLRVFKNRSYATGVFMMTVLGFVLYGATVLIPIYLQQLLGYSALDAGWAMLPRGLGSFIAMPFVGILMSKVEPRKLLFIGLSVAAYSLWDLSHVNLNAGYWDVFWPQFIQGMSMGFVFVPLTTVTHDSIPKEQMGNATSLFNLMRNIGASVGIAMVTTIVARQTQSNINVLGTSVNPSNPAATQMTDAARAWFMSQGMDSTTAGKQAVGALWGEVQRQASMVSFIHAFRFLAIMFVAVLPLILIMRKTSGKGGGGAAMH
ncbi:MAG TPA: DHA2 family efflux MFS transporter permease subunit [Terriglobales bacterium]|nr:DHA2 family efflux MFS transporter permease subunit [Terriglobales bacterium]